MTDDEGKPSKQKPDRDGEGGDDDEEERPKGKKEKKGKKDKKDKKEKPVQSDDENDNGSSEDDGKKGKKDRDNKKPKGNKNKKVDSEFQSIYEGLEDEPWEPYDEPAGCLQMSQLKNEINTRGINEPAVYDRDGKAYRWARLGEKGHQQLLIGPLYFLSMGELTTEQYGDAYFYCAVPKEQFSPIENSLNKQLSKAEKKFRSKGHTQFAKKEMTCKLPAMERFRLGLIARPDDENDGDAKLETDNCTLVQFPLSVSDPSKFTVTCGDKELVLRDVFERLPGVIGYANVTVVFSAEVPCYTEDDSAGSDDDGNKKKGKSSSSKKKSKSHKTKQQDPMDPGSSASKVGVKFKVSSISIVGQTIAKAVPMSESVAIESVKPSSALLSVMKRRT